MAGRVFGKYAELIPKESCQRQAFCALSSEMEAFCEFFLDYRVQFLGLFLFSSLFISYICTVLTGKMMPPGLKWDQRTHKFFEKAITIVYNP